MRLNDKMKINTDRCIEQSNGRIGDKLFTPKEVDSEVSKGWAKK